MPLATKWPRMAICNQEVNNWVGGSKCLLFCNNLDTKLKNSLKCGDLLYHCTRVQYGFSLTKGHFLWHKLCGSIHYNVQYYVVFIITYVTLKWQLDIRYWNIYCKCYMCHLYVIYFAIKITYCTGWNHKLYPMHEPWLLCEKTTFYWSVYYLNVLL
jgi:hypothetical protein